MKIIISKYRSAEQNLALEQSLLEGSDEAILLYVNERCVVVGRNQVIDAEIDTEFCRRFGIEVVRRQSGGGTVYHDLGNLNYAIICNASQNPLDKEQNAPIVWALQQLGVDAKGGRRGEITVGDAKVSGSASMVRRGRVLFHGTLLFDADLAALEAALKGREELRGKGVASVRSKVANLKPLLSGCDTIEEFAQQIKEALEKFYHQR